MGTTRKPCHGCGKGGFSREADEVCGDCQSLIEDGKKYRKELSENKEKIPVVPGRAHLYINGWNRRDSAQENLEDALFKLSMIVSSPDISRRPAADYESLFSRADSIYHSKKLIMDKVYFDALKELYSTIETALKSAFFAGKSRGQNVLMRLHSGEMGINEYNREIESQ